MIVQRLATTRPTCAFVDLLQQAIDFLRSTDVVALAAGRHEIDGDRLFALVQSYTTRPLERCEWEAHRRYVDVQYIVSGVERMGYVNLANARERQEYDPGRDVALFEPGTDAVTVHAGMFAVFGPEDVHAPGGAAGQPGPVRKIVVKVAAADYFPPAAASHVSTSASDGPPRVR